MAPRIDQILDYATRHGEYGAELRFLIACDDGRQAEAVDNLHAKWDRVIASDPNWFNPRQTPVFDESGTATFPTPSLDQLEDPPEFDWPERTKCVRCGQPMTTPHGVCADCLLGGESH